MPENDEARYLWKEIAAINALHGELASLYRVKSNDRKRINLLWNVIEEKEALLFLEHGYELA